MIPWVLNVSEANRKKFLQTCPPVLVKPDLVTQMTPRIVQNLNVSGILLSDFSFALKKTKRNLDSNQS